MDFLKSAINAEISKKRKALDTASERAGSKKYVSRAELERLREEEYRREEEERLAKEKEKKEKQRQEQERLKEQEKQQAKLDSKKESVNEEVEIETFNISREEVVRRLRAKGQPIRLFGETDKQCKIRLRALELMEERSEDQGQRNDFMRKLEEMEEGMKLEVLKQKAGVVDGKKEKKSKKADLIVAPIELKLLQSDRDKLFMQIYAYLVTLEPDILARVAEITHHMQNRRYRDAQDSYLQLSIGNAPWPIGVTMVGIHERSAREKIFSSQVAHVLNDETSRKWIQSVKRLMTFAQSKYPPYTLSQIA
ncbi:mRNA splicing protein prp18 [Apophysomyces ossiformis]|uniref:Pre-mRNA-splicing factor 18 n=1 Tax=Apophysomyces ossiformis TaxID=679940 RepID=A0A8H7BJU7_9FUNG|nr:mRNA splicing protein prp18 [Apophysomyces ossiformis]